MPPRTTDADVPPGGVRVHASLPVPERRGRLATLVSFLLIMLLYATYQPLRFAIEDPERQARYASVFAITAGAFVPLNFIAVRLSASYVHPRVLGSASNLPPSMAFTFGVSLAAMALLFATLCSYELTAKRTRMLLKARSRILGFQ